MLLVLVGLCVLAAVESQDGESRLVTVEQGPILGYRDSTRDIFEFINVPYATAPTGRQRFKAPLPPPVWVQPLEAVDRGIACHQSQQGESWNVREDCLVANIYAPDTNETNLSVVVYVHGGAYQVRRGTYNSVKALVRTNKIIAITFNYRLGIHGFLCLGTEAAPGNAGMKDQVALIRWVKRNIASFGGNPDDITLVGCSAGGGSVDLLTLSPMTAGLFQRAIPQSGCNMGALGIQIDPLENAKNHARSLTFNNVEDIDALEEFYTTAPFELLATRTDLIMNREISTITFAPCVEHDLSALGIETFLNDTPVNIMQSGKYVSVPLLYGFTNMEGGMRRTSFNTWKDGMNEKFSDFLIEDLQFDSEEQKEEVANTIKEFYFGDQPVSEENILQYVNYFTDMLFFYPMLRSLKLRKESKNDTIYLYEYSFVDENSSSLPNTNFSGAAHCAQDNAVLLENVVNATDEYLAMQTIMRELWINFILTGNPEQPSSSISWPPAEASWTPYMSLGRAVELKHALPKLEQALFWEDIYSKHYRPPVPPGTATGSAFSYVISKYAIFFVLSIHIRYYVM